jgi:[ribosomal protein S5]-alanine N-acetyltransferase
MRLETERLVLRHAQGTDVPTLFTFLGDAKAMQHTHVDGSLRACRKRVMVHEWFRRRDGYAPWVVLRKSDGRTIGWGGLYNDPFDRGWGCEIGYFFHPDTWGQGYASELMGAALAVADNDLKLPEVRAFAHPDNAASQRVLQKAGFAKVRFIPAMDRFLFSRVRGRHRLVP